MAQTPARIEPALARSIRHLVARLADLHALLPQVNDPDLQARLRLLATIGPGLGRAHLPAPGPDVADALAGLLAAALALDVPEEDPELGPTPTLSAILSAKGLIIGGVTNALKAAEAAGFTPARDPIPREQAVAIPRLRYQDKLRSIEQRLGDVVTRLDALDRTRDSLQQQRPAFVQQNELIDLYVGAMRVETNLAQLQLTSGDANLDLNSISRAIHAIGSLTRHFVATVKGWVARVAPAVTEGAEAMRATVTRLAWRVRAFARSLGRTSLPTEPVSIGWTYKAFISYSYKDARAARFWQRLIEEFVIPPSFVGVRTSRGTVPEHLWPVFRDRQNFVPGSLIGEPTLKALDESGALVLLASPNAASSFYVNEEVRYFRAHHPDRPIIPVIIGPSETALRDMLPPALMQDFDTAGNVTGVAAERTSVDPRKSGDGKRKALAKIVAALLGIHQSQLHLFVREASERTRWA